MLRAVAFTQRDRTVIQLSPAEDHSCRGLMRTTVRDLRRWMVILGDDRSAALVIRVWLEEGTDQFRGRLTAAETSSAAGGGEDVTVAVAASPRELTDAVSHWLQDFSRDAAKRIDTG